MKFTRAPLTIVCTNDFIRAGRSCRQPGRPAVGRKSTMRRLPSRLVARWHVSPLTQRLECAWSLEHSDGQLCRSHGQIARLIGKRRRLSQIPNQL
jgi:hypothetical protein